ncbi:MAG: heparinase II/III family protein [Pseudomonadota bacterium]
MAQSDGRTSLGRSIAAQAQKVWRLSPVAQLRLDGPVPDRLAASPVDPYTPNPAFGRAFLEGRVVTGGDWANADEFWARHEVVNEASRYAHSFAWARDCVATGDDAREDVRDLIDGWIARFGGWREDVWAPDLTAERLAAWLCTAEWVSRDGALFRSRFLASIARQTRHLAETAHKAGEGAQALTAAATLAAAGLCVPQAAGAAERGLELLRRELRIQMLADGGHMSRNPAIALHVAVALRRIAGLSDARSLETPAPIRHALDRTAAHLRFHRLADGGLAAFNGGTEGDRKALDYACAEGDESSSTPFGFASASGYLRAQAARARLIVDAGDPPPPPYGAAAHASALSFTLASGRRRLVVNCGDGTAIGASWMRALRLDEAHSTAILRFADGPVRWTRTSGAKRENDEGRWIEVERDGVVAGRLVLQTRRIYVSAEGDDIRGEDAVDAGEASLSAATLRFHLHHDARATPCRDGRSILITLDNKEAWRFRASAARVRLEGSVYSPDGGQPRTTNQIVVDCRDEVGDSVKWGLRRLEHGG